MEEATEETTRATEAAMGSQEKAEEEEKRQLATTLKEAVLASLPEQQLQLHKWLAKSAS